jgi:hypothetical protein
MRDASIHRAGWFPKKTGARRELHLHRTGLVPLIPLRSPDFRATICATLGDRRMVVPLYLINLIGLERGRAILRALDSPAMSAPGGVNAAWP